MLVDLTESIFCTYLRFSEGIASFFSFLFSVEFYFFFLVVACLVLSCLVCTYGLTDAGLERESSESNGYCFASNNNQRTNLRACVDERRKENKTPKCFKESEFDTYLYMIAAGLVREEERGNMYSIELNRQPWERG